MSSIPRVNGPEGSGPVDHVDAPGPSVVPPTVGVSLDDHVLPGIESTVPRIDAASAVVSFFSFVGDPLGRHNFNRAVVSSKLKEYGVAPMVESPHDETRRDRPRSQPTDPERSVRFAP